MNVSAEVVLVDENNILSFIDVHACMVHEPSVGVYITLMIHCVIYFPLTICDLFSWLNM